jgi:DNA repair protein RecO (recombination protein O)
VISKTDAVVLQTRRYGETSKIVTLYTREYGKVSAIARGAMQSKSKYGPVLQPMAYLSTVIYRKEGRDLQTLSAAEPVERFGVLSQSLERMSAGLAIVELINATMHDEDPNDPLFTTLVDALRALNDSESDESNVLLWFTARLASLLGYAIRTDDCGVCQEPVEITSSDVAYSLAMGAPLCAEHRDAASYRPLPAAAFDLLRRICAANVETAARLDSDEHAKAILKDALSHFIRFHVEGLRRLNVSQVTMKVLGEVSPAG